MAIGSKLRLGLLAFGITLMWAPAASGIVVELVPAGTSSSYDSGDFATEGVEKMSVQLCGGTGGDVVSGTLTVYQGNKSGNTTSLWTTTLSSQSGCNAASFVGVPGPAAFTRIVFTHTGGTYGIWLLRSPK